MSELGFDLGAGANAGDSVVHLPGLYTGPPPSPPTCPNPFAIPSASILAKQIIDSDNKLFFISWKIGFSVREWRLVHVALSATTSSYPSCFDDGKYIVNFYTRHPSDSRMNAVNQRFWLRYHSQLDLVDPCASCDTHLIRPTDTSEAYALRHNLYPFRQYVNLTHLDTFIHGPFNFATFRGGSKSRDRVSGDDWAALRSRISMFHNSVPSMEVTTYSVHIDSGAHTTFTSGSPFGGISPHTRARFPAALSLTKGHGYSAALERDFQQLYP
jgi:hypothetical protein